MDDVHGTTRRKYILLAMVAVAAMVASIVAVNNSGQPPQKIAVAPPAKSPLSHVRVKSSVSGQTIDAGLPYYRKGSNGEMLDFTFTIDYADNQPAIFSIVPDDCIELLEINGKKVELTGEALYRHCDWKHGFRLDLAPYLHAGANSAHAVVRNVYGWTGLRFQLAR